MSPFVCQHVLPPIKSAVCLPSFSSIALGTICWPSLGVWCMKYTKFAAHCSVDSVPPLPHTLLSLEKLPAWVKLNVSLHACVVSVFMFSVCVCVLLLAWALQSSEAYCVLMHTCKSHEGSTHWSVDGPRTTIIHMEGPSQFLCCHTALSDCVAKQPVLWTEKLGA